MFHQYSNFVTRFYIIRSIRTATQFTELHAVNRLRTAQLVAELLRGYIEQAQNTALDETVARTALAQIDAPPKLRQAILDDEPEGPVRQEAGRYHAAAFTCLAFNAASCIVSFTIIHPVWTAIDSLLVLAAMVCFLTAVIRQSGCSVPSGLRMLVWVGLGWTCLSYMINLVYGVVLYTMDPELAQNIWRGAVTSPDVIPGNLLITAIFLVIDIQIAIAGLAMTFQYQRNLRAAEPSAPPTDEAGAE